MKLFSLILISVVCCSLSNCNGNFYVVQVHTADRPDAETSGWVYISLIGLEGNSSMIRLHDPTFIEKRRHLEFSRSKTNHFYIKIKDVGKLQKIRMSLVSPKYSDETLGLPDFTWFLEEVHVKDLKRREFQWFPYNNWLNISRSEAQHTVYMYSWNASVTEYKLTVKTGDRENAGTHGKVFITLHGENGNSRKILLSHKKKTEFQRNQTDTFHITTEDIGIVREIRVELDSTAKSKSPDWLLKLVSLRDLTRKQSQRFIWNQWLTPTKDQKTVSVDIQTSP